MYAVVSTISSESAGAGGLSPRQLRLVTVTLAVVGGAAVANLYYAQPVLELISRSLHVSPGVATTAVTATQIGYAVGVAFVLPLGDLLENRALASGTLLVAAIALVALACAPDYGVFLAAAVVVGLTSVVGQILVPFAASLAPPEQRGRFVGQVMSGLLLGILLARSVASLVAAAAGWRTIYVVSAIMMVGASLAVRRIVPRMTPAHRSGYGQLLKSTLRLAAREPVLRRRALAQASIFGAFTAYWTAIGYELIDAHGFRQADIAIFALVGATGAAVASVGGRLGDRGLGPLTRAGALVLVSGAMVLAWLGASHVVLLGAAAVLLDIGAQIHTVLSQRDIYALQPDARARVNSVFMTVAFMSGATASALTGVIHTAYGWTGVMIFAACSPMLGLLMWVREYVVAHRLRNALLHAEVDAD
jgi:predicted MFS family arabinose efflux permease